MITLNYKGYWLKYRGGRWQVWDTFQENLLATCDTEQAAKDFVLVDKIASGRSQ